MGWDKKGSLEYSDYIGWEEEMTFDEIVLDPLFWQALGKALGKEDEDYTDDPFADWKYWEWWKGAAHHYFDIILTGGDTEKFWSELLDRKESNEK